MMRNKIGVPVCGDDFFDRKDKTAQIRHLLNQGNNVLLLAPRRVGKTSLMRRLQELENEHGLKSIFVDVSDCADERAFVKELYKELGKIDKSGGIFNVLQKNPAVNALKSLKKVEGYGFAIEFNGNEAEDWQKAAELLYDCLDKLSGKHLFMVDEVPVFTLRLSKLDAGAQRVADFLHWFRKLRQNRENIQWIAAGSIGLDTVTARLKLGGAINDFAIVKLGAFSDEVAGEFIVKLAESHKIHLKPDTVKHIVAKIGWPMPYYLQLVFSELFNLFNESGKAPDVAAVDKSYENLLSPSNKGYFDHWIQRLTDELGKPDDLYALELLDIAAKDPKGVLCSNFDMALDGKINDADKRNEKTQYLLDILENDGYLVNTEGRFAFRSPLLRDFWLRRRAK